MSSQRNSTEFKSWLDKLQQESWQLELLVSAFVIFGLFQSLDPIEIEINRLMLSKDAGLGVVFALQGYVIVAGAIYVLLFNLIVHLVLRGLWIGAIGLRYFSGDIDFDSLKYAPKFDTYLKKKIGSFDTFIARLEDYCSVIFSFTFLLIFFLLSYILLLLPFNIMAIFLQDFLDSIFVKIIFLIVFVLYTIILLLLAFDFFSQGLLKKKKWTAWFYFPIYRFMSYVSLSIAYRPVLYNFLDNKLGKRMLFFAVPFYMILLFVSGVKYNYSNYHDSDNESEITFLLSENYYDEISEDPKAFVERASIASKRVSQSSLQLFLTHKIEIEDAVYAVNDTLKPKDDKRGFLGKGIFGSQDKNGTVNSGSLEAYLSTLNSVLKIKVDSSVVEPSFKFGWNTKDQKGYETYLDLIDLKRGLHHLQIDQKYVTRDSTLKEKTIARIPFWYYPD